MNSQFSALDCQQVYQEERLKTVISYSYVISEFNTM